MLKMMAPGEKNFPSIVASYGLGTVLPTNGFVEGDNMAGKPIDHFQSFPEIVFNRFSMVTGIGNYLAHAIYNTFHQFYQRIGIKLYLLKNLYMGVNVRTVEFATAEYLEFCLGYRACSGKRKIMTT